MWNELSNSNDIDNLLKAYGGFHDSCLATLEYTSGVCVTDDLAMRFDKSSQSIRMIFQRQYQPPKSIEVMFENVEKFNLLLFDQEVNDGIILDVSMFWEGGKIYWGDSCWFKVQRAEYDGTWICAEKARWRIID